MDRRPVTHQYNRGDDRDCPHCGRRMIAVHGHYECRATSTFVSPVDGRSYVRTIGCGYRDSCCDGGEQ